MVCYNDNRSGKPRSLDPSFRDKVSTIITLCPLQCCICGTPHYVILSGNNNTGPYVHNGFFQSLEDVVHFYSSRDVPEEAWPAPEVAETVNSDELGNLGLTAEAEAAIVAFMNTLTDGQMPDGMPQTGGPACPPTRGSWPWAGW